MHQPWPPAFADYLTRKHYWLHPSRMGGEAHLKVELDASTGFPGRASAPWVRGKVHTGVTRGSIQFVAPFREPEKNPVVDLALSRANTADWLCARRFPGDCASMTPRFISTGKGASAAKSLGNASGLTARKPSPTGPMLLAAGGILSARSDKLSPTSGWTAAT